jgi:hypothetical protein
MHGSIIAIVHPIPVKISHHMQALQNSRSLRFGKMRRYVMHIEILASTTAGVKRTAYTYASCLPITCVSIKIRSFKRLSIALTLPPGIALARSMSQACLPVPYLVATQLSVVSVTANTYPKYQPDSPNFCRNPLRKS